MLIAANTHITVSSINASLDGEPRMLDHDVAKALGFSRLADIRSLIERNIVALERFGEVFRTVRKTSKKGGRPGVSYWLNQKQVIYICSKSETENATEITIQAVEVFSDYLSGSLVSVKPHTRSKPTVIKNKVSLSDGRYIVRIKDGILKSSREIDDHQELIDGREWTEAFNALNRLKTLKYVM